MFRFLIQAVLLRCQYYALLFLYYFAAWNAGSAGFLFYQAIMFGHPFGWALGFGLDWYCVQLCCSLCCYTLIL